MGCADMLNQLGVIPSEHKCYDSTIAERKMTIHRKIPTRVKDELVSQSVSNSLYTFYGLTTENRYEPMPCNEQMTDAPATNPTSLNSQEITVSRPLTPMSLK